MPIRDVICAKRLTFIIIVDELRFTRCIIDLPLCHPLIPPRQHDDLWADFERALPLRLICLALLPRSRGCFVGHVVRLFGRAYTDLLGLTVLHANILRCILEERPLALCKTALKSPHFTEGKVLLQLIWTRVGGYEQGFAA